MLRTGRGIARGRRLEGQCQSPLPFSRQPGAEIHTKYRKVKHFSQLLNSIDTKLSKLEVAWYPFGRSHWEDALGAVVGVETCNVEIVR